MKIIAPHFAVSEAGSVLSLEWWEGDRSLCCWFDAAGEDTYHGIGKGPNGEQVHHGFPNLHAAYRWLVGESVPDAGRETGGTE